MEMFTYPNCRESIWLAVLSILWIIVVQIILIIAGVPSHLYSIITFGSVAVALAIAFRTKVMDRSIMSELNIKMPQSTTYADLLNKGDYLFLDSIVNRHFKTGLKRMFMKPNYLSLFLGQMQEAEKLKKTGDSKAPINSTTSQVMDLILRVKAKEKGYTTTGLETISEQMNLLFPDTDLTKQASMLIKALRCDSAYSELTVLSETLPAIYRSQKMENLVDFEVKADSLYQTSVELKKIGEHQREVLLKRRNVNWINKIPELIKDKSTFIAVGVRHLPGKNGLITLLREKGYKVEAWGM